MSRLIDADKFKRENERMLNCDFPYISEETLGELIDKAPTVEAVPMDFHDRCMEIEIEKRFAIEKHGQWIPCSERLPEYDGEMYLVTDYCEQINRRRLHISYCYVNREGFWSDVPMGYKVVAWMPLPEPYKMDEVSE